MPTVRPPDPGPPTDADLLRRFAATRDPAAFELLVWRHGGLVRAAAFAVLRDRHLAEDAAQAAFLLLAQHAGRVRTNPAGWLYRTARRAAVRLGKQQRRAGGVSPLFLPGWRTFASGQPATQAETGGLRPPLAYDADELAILHAEMARLPDRYRLPLLLCACEGLTHPAAAARLGWPVGTVAGRLHRAKLLLRDRLTRRGVTAGLGLLAADAAGGGFVHATATAGVAFAAGAVAGVSPSVLLLTKGLVRAMTVTKWATACGLFAVTAALTGGGLLAVAQQPAGEPPILKPEVTGVAGTLVLNQRLPIQVDPTKPNPGTPEDPKRAADFAQRQRSLKALRRIAFAMHAHHDAHGHFPADYRGNSGRPFLSWRVALLPYLHKSPFGDDKADEAKFAALFKRFNLDEPWDGPTNKPLLAEMPDVLRLGFQPNDATDTYYQGFAGPGTAFEPGKRLDYNQFNDGTSNTLTVAEVGPAVPWTKPQDVGYDPDKPFPGVRWPFTNVVHTVFADGHIEHWRPDVPELLLRQLVSRNGGEVYAIDRSMRPRLVAESPEEKAAVARLIAAAKAKLAEIDRLAPGVNSQEDAEYLDGRLKGIVDDLRPAVKPPTK